MTSTKTTLFALTTLLLSSSAFAADVFSGDKSLKDDKNYASGETVNWTGFYIGGAVGYGNANHDLTVHEYFEDYCAASTDTTTGFGGTAAERGVTVENLNLLFPSAFESCEKLAAAPTTPTGLKTVNGDSREIAGIDGVNSHGLVGDVRVGYDLAFGRFLIGGFGSYGFNSMETSGFISGLGSASIEKGDEWSIGARAGLIVAPRTLAYILAAYTQSDWEFGVAGAGGGGGSREITFDGVTVGGGVEFALTSNVFLGIEGVHTFYGEETILDSYNSAANAGGRLNDELGETKVLGTLKIKLNSGLGLGN
jgi:opacity protein-like surface antigen